MHRVLKKLLCGIAVLATLLGFGSCGLRYVPGYSYKEEKQILERIKAILVDLLDSAQSQDEITFETFFADHVVAMSDFEDGKNYVFDTYDGNLIRIEGPSNISSTGEEIGSGYHNTNVFTWFNVITDQSEYKVLLEIYINAPPNNSYKIRKFKIYNKQEADQHNQADMNLRYGVYYPGWIEEQK